MSVTSPIDTIDVTGSTYGVINLQEEGNIIEACTPANDRTGLYEVYSINFRFNIYEEMLDGPWIYQ